MLNLAQQYNKSIVEESTLTSEQLKIRHVGKQDPKRHLNDAVEKAMGQQVVQSLGMGVLSEVSNVEIAHPRDSNLTVFMSLRYLQL